MTNRQYLILVILIIFMGLSANGLGRWAERISPDGIIPQTPVTAADAPAEATAAETTTEPAEPRSAYTFGASMGLLGIGLLYCLIAAGLLIQATTKRVPAGRFVYCVAGLAAISFALSYLVDDYFY